jgi:hypothetical protein
MNVEIGTEAALFPEKEYTNGIFVAVYSQIGPLSPVSIPQWMQEKIRKITDSGTQRRVIVMIFNY